MLTGCSQVCFMINLNGSLNALSSNNSWIENGYILYDQKGMDIYYVCIFG